jgi:DNA (cytosine-5)-methyltransferase 1
MRLLDLFCKAGGAAVGYHRAGFDEIVGIDIEPQKRYPFEFVQCDALEYVRDHWMEFDAIHASPPCQAYSRSRNNGCHKNAPALIGNTRAYLERTCIPWVIENVQGAPLVNAVILCGASFGLRTGIFDLARHRQFETSFFLMGIPCAHHRGKTIGVYGNGTNSWHRKKFGRCVSIDEQREAMGIDWMSRAELTQAIPPAYTEFIGKQLRDHIEFKKNHSADFSS